MSSRAWTGGTYAPMEDESADISRWYTTSMDASTGSDAGLEGGDGDGLR
jgi:hypothetical protein